MSEITAEMIERGRGTDRRVAAERRKLSRKVQDARDKLTSAGHGDRSFTIDLLGLYAERRMAAAPAVAVVGAGLTLLAIHWTSLAGIFGWLSLDAVAIFVSYRLAGRFLREDRRQLRTITWTRAFVSAEVLQGTVWAILVLATSRVNDPQALTYVLIAMLLVAAMNAAATAPVPAAVCGAIAPMALGITLGFHPSHLTDGNLLLVVAALCTLLYFVYMADRIRASSLQALLFQAEKDDLIAELERSNANSDLARRRAEESNLAKSRFLAAMSHELRTPLNAILGFSEIMRAESFGRHAVPAYRDYARDIHLSGEHLLTLINGILDLSRVEAGRFELCEAPIDLFGLIDECSHLIALRAQKKKIQVLRSREDDLPRLWADTRAVRQVALNLLSNAIKFTPPGGLVSIQLGEAADGGQFFSITDTGVGIPESEIPIVMSSFGRGMFAQRHAEEGAGLGLPIVKGLVELHGGTFDLMSKVREGTTATVTFPPERVMSVSAHEQTRRNIRRTCVRPPKQAPPANVHRSPLRMESSRLPLPSPIRPFWSPV